MRSWSISSTKAAVLGCATANLDLCDRDGMEDRE